MGKKCYEKGGVHVMINTKCWLYKYLIDDYMSNLCRDIYQGGQHMSYILVFFYAGSSSKRKYCRNDWTNDNSFFNIINVNSTIQVHRVLWFGFYHTGSQLK